MCIIAILQPKYTFTEGWKHCITNNQDGYGWAIPDGKGGLEVYKSAECANYEEFCKALHGHKLPVMLHLRYTTAGATNLTNAHPFQILTKKEDGVDLVMCHNGTLHAYESKDKSDPNSDTFYFVKNFVRPLFKRLIKGLSSEEILSDPLIEFILDQQLTMKSVITFIDGFGNTLVVNATGNGGGWQEGIYCSNKYSFDPNHRLPTSYYSGGYVVGYTNGKKNGTNGSVKGNGDVNSGASNIVVHDPPTPVKPLERYSTMAQGSKNILPISELRLMSDGFIEDLVKNDKDIATLLIKELLTFLPKDY